VSASTRDPQGLSAEDEVALARVLQLLRERLAVDVGHQKRERLLRRLYRRLRSQALESLPAYANALERDPAELRQLAHELQIPPAHLFRDPRVLTGLAGALPAWLTPLPQPRIWVPGCSSGDELFALMLLAAEALPERVPSLQFLGTDSDPLALAAARRGVLDADDARALPPALRRWVHRGSDGEVSLVPALRTRAQIERLDLLTAPTLPPFDLICCRNLLASLELHAQRQLLEVMAAALRPGGRLLVAADEAGLVHPDLFVNIAQGEGSELPGLFRRRAPSGAESPEGSAREEVQGSAFRASFDAAAQPMLLLDREGRIEAANPAAVALFEQPLQGLRGTPAETWIVTVPGVSEAPHRLQPLAGGRALLVIELAADSSRLQLALAEQQERQSLAEEMLREAVILIDAQGRLEAFPPAAERLSGWRALEAIGQPWARILKLVDGEGKPLDLFALDDVAGGAQGRLHREGCVLISRDGRRLSVRVDLSPPRQLRGRAFRVLMLTDTTEHTLLSEELAYRAAHDPLTGLLGRDEFERRLANALSEARRQAQTAVFAYFDLDQFKVINDMLGHFAGDELLRQFASLLRAGMGSADLLARLGGDEFGLLLDNCTLEDGQARVERLLQCAREFRFHWDGQSYGITVSAGLSLIEARTPSTARLLSDADAACYAAKDGGRDRLHVAGNSDDFSRRQGEMGMVARINRALDDDLFELYYEDVVRCRQPGKVVYRELLLRMRDPANPQQLIAPGLFIPVAERYYLMGAVDRWVLDAVLAGLRQRPADGVLYAVNVSGLSLNDSKFLPYVLSRFDLHGVAPEQICFEITETAAITHLKEARHFIERLADVGCSFALDDFGVGMSSFSYLKNLPVGYVKIDGSFVRSMLQNRVDRSMVEAINRIGHDMGLKTIAEHVEDPALLGLLDEMGVDYAQGWAVGRSQSFRQLLASAP
jgi:diguanylate cyclase (GGDEF)-like protein/PAS domain S-box-containing protein